MGFEEGVQREDLRTDGALRRGFEFGFGAGGQAFFFGSFGLLF